MPKTATAAPSLAELAQLLGISKTRCHQLVDDGVITRAPGGGFDPLQSALALLGWYRRDEQTKQARLRLLHATAANHERRMRRQLGQLLTTAELREVLLLVFEAGWQLVQRETAVFHNEVAGRLPDDKARIAAHQVYDHLRRLMLGYRDGVDELVRVVETEALPGDKRVADVFAEIMRAVDEGDVPDDRPRKAVRRRNGSGRHA